MTEMLSRFFGWLGAILEQKDHPITKSFGDGMRYFAIAALMVTASMGLGAYAADDYGTVEKLADVVKVLLGAGGLAGARALRG
jgi:hypothetical protein